MVEGRRMRVAAVDCGTNSIRLLIADIDGDNFREVHRDMQVVRLGQGVDKNKAFAPEAIERTLAATSTYADVMRRKGVERVRFCATSATRDATNREIFISGVENILGVAPEVIPGSEEAALSFMGATKELGQELAPFLVVDIGGGSTEFVLGSQSVQAARSVNIGCVRMHERHLNSQPPTKAQIEAATADIDHAISEAAAEVDFSAAHTLIAVAGTATTVAAGALGLNDSGRRIRTALDGAQAACLNSTPPTVARRLVVSRAHAPAARATRRVPRVPLPAARRPQPARRVRRARQRAAARV